jgi:hypothetical protein
MLQSLPNHANVPLGISGVSRTFGVNNLRININASNVKLLKKPRAHLYDVLNPVLL